MRRSTIWYLLAAAWAIDCVLSLLHHNRQQVLLTALFATVFLAAGIAFRAREQKNLKAAEGARKQQKVSR
jgi:hypothetical protein